MVSGRRLAGCRGGLDVVNSGSLALMVVVTLELGRAAFVGWLTVVLAGVSVLPLIRFRVNSARPVLGRHARRPPYRRVGEAILRVVS